MTNTPNLIIEAAKAHGYTWHPGKLVKPYDLFVFGIRNKVAKVDAWDDVLGCIYLDASLTLQCVLWRGTTDPGLSSLVDPMNRAGCAIVVPGQYRQSHKLGMHKGKSPAMVQVAPIKVYRDENKDAVFNFDAPTSGYFGINLHSPWKDDLARVGAASAGCQVFHAKSDLEALLALVKEQAAHGLGDVVTYTLFSDDSLQPLIALVK